MTMHLRVIKSNLLFIFMAVSLQTFAQNSSDKLITRTVTEAYQNTYLVSLFDSPCADSKLINNYPKKAEVLSLKDNSLAGVSCYIANKSNELVFITGQNYTSTLPFSVFEYYSERLGGSNQSIPEPGGGGNTPGNIFSAIANGLNAGYATANPPQAQPVQPLQPGVVQGRPYQPYQGVNQPSFKQRNCTSVINGNVVNTNCY